MGEWEQATPSQVAKAHPPKPKPTSEILLEARKEWKRIPDNTALLAISKEALRLPEEVRLWLTQLEDVACISSYNRAGAKKAAAKRRERRTNLRQRTDMAMFSVHATVKSHHSQTTAMTKMMTNRLNG